MNLAGLHGNLHTAHLWWNACHPFKVSAAQLPNPKFHFNVQLKTDAPNLIVIKAKSNAFCPMEDSSHLAVAESPLLCGKRLCVIPQDHRCQIGLGLSRQTQYAQKELGFII